jgi:hypothetical protein
VLRFKFQQKSINPSLLASSLLSKSILRTTNRLSRRCTFYLHAYSLSTGCSRSPHLGPTCHRLARHHALALSRAWSRLVVLLKLIALECLLVLDLLLRVLVGLQDQVVLLLARLQMLVHLILQLLTERVHFVLLFLHQIGLRSKNLFVTILHVLLSFFFFNFVRALLDLMSLLIVLLFGQVLLDLPHIQQLGRVLEIEWQ